MSHTQKVRRLFEEHASQLRGFFRRRVRNAPDAVDLAQDAWRTDYLGVIGVLPITATDTQLTVNLNDGSRLHLNAGARVRVHFTRAERRLELEAGQALSDVAHDRSRPFRVQAGAADVISVGTRFDVNRHARALTVTVVEGKVDLVDTTAGTSEPGKIEAPAGVTDELNRYLDKPIVIQDAGLRALRISGVFNAYDSESFLAFLRQYDVEIDTRDNVIYVRARVNQPSVRSEDSGVRA